MIQAKFISAIKHFCLNLNAYDPVSYYTIKLRFQQLTIFSFIRRDPRFLIRTQGGRSSLSCERADARDTAWYQCTAASVAGTATNRARLNVQGKVLYQLSPRGYMIQVKGTQVV